MTATTEGTWEVSSPIPLNHGHFLPSALTTSSRRRLLAVEIHTQPGKVCYVRISYPGVGKATTIKGTSKILDGAFSSVDFVKKNVEGKSKTLDGALSSVDGFVKKNVEKARNKPHHHLDDSYTDDDDVLAAYQETSSITTNAEGWHPRYKVPLRIFNIVEKKKRSVVIKYMGAKKSAYREFVFESDSAMSDFCTVIERNKALMTERLKSRVESALGTDIKLQKDEKLILLIDICSGINLPCTDKIKNSDPYVVVRWNRKKIHKTDYMKTTLNPIWTLKKKSLFLWTVDALELFQSEEGLMFEVKDYDMIGGKDSMGAFEVGARTLYTSNGERLEYALKPLLGQPDYKTGKIFIRIRRATEYDIDFIMKHDRETKEVSAVGSGGEKLKNMITGTAGGIVGTAEGIVGTARVTSKKAKEGPDSGSTIYLVRPGPDPKRKDSTTWLTKEKIEEEMMHESIEWTDIGSGHLGKIFVEILSCDGLPNMDAVGVGSVKAQVLNDKTDAFISLVYEDCAARTDIIDNCLSPRWLPWSKRAFIFHTMHTSSPLFVGVFDFDRGFVNRHDQIGRVTIDLSNFYPGTTYLLEYNLFRDANFGPREAKFGTVKIRLRMELANERTLLLSSMSLPFSVNVNEGSKKEFDVIKQTVEGSVNPRKFSVRATSSYCDELLCYLSFWILFQELLVSLLLWRGQDKFSLPIPSFSSPHSVKWVDVHFPINSLALFVCLVILAENYDLFPAFFFAAVGWAMLSASRYRANNPNPWMCCKSFPYLLTSFVTNTTAKPHQIHVNEGVAEDRMAKTVQDVEEKVKTRAAEYAKTLDQQWSELTETSGDFSTSNLDPTQVQLELLQYWLRTACLGLRIFKNIIVWQECYISFWITLTSFIVSFVLLFVPWGFLIKWTLRITVWVFFGPWMKLADIYYFSAAEDDVASMNTLQLTMYNWLEKAKHESQLAKEKMHKMRDFKKFMFGKHSMTVNILKKDRFYDIPLPSSSATVYVQKPISIGELAMEQAGYRHNRVHGQHLIGEMVPKVFDNLAFDDGKSARFADIYDGHDSFASAILKVGDNIGELVAITWHGANQLADLVRFRHGC